MHVVELRQDFLNVKNRVYQVLKRSETLSTEVKKQNKELLKELKELNKKGENVDETYKSTDEAYRKSTYNTTDQAKKKDKLDKAHRGMANFGKKGSELLNKYKQQIGSSVSWYYQTMTSGHFTSTPSHHP